VNSYSSTRPTSYSLLKSILVIYLDESLVDTVDGICGMIELRNGEDVTERGTRQSQVEIGDGT
jgi:hypothetical protein